VLNYDFATKPIDEPFSDEELAGFSFQGFRDRVIQHSGKKNQTVRDFINVSGRGTVKEHVMFCGNPRPVADQMEEWFTAPACDGFVLAATSMPGAYDASGLCETVLITDGESGRSGVGRTRNVVAPTSLAGQFEQPYGPMGPPTWFTIPVLR
jgi:hypothetical protein